MSDVKNNENALQEKEEKVVVSPEDVNSALDFWRHFNIPIPADLQSAVDAFAADQSFSNQQRVKLEVCRAISTQDHEAFKDEMFVKIVEECAGVAFKMDFDKEFEATVSNTETK